MLCSTAPLFTVSRIPDITGYDFEWVDPGITLKEEKV